MSKIRIFCFLMLTFLLVGCGDVTSSAQLSDDIPDFTLVTPEGDSVTMSTFKGDNPLILVFFATWCPPCVREIPELIDIYRTYSGQGLKMLAVNIDESPARIKGFIKQKGIPYTVVIDRGGQVAHSYGVVGIPTLILMDKEGNVRYRGHGIPRDIEEVL